MVPETQLTIRTEHVFQPFRRSGAILERVKVCSHMFFVSKS